MTNVLNEDDIGELKSLKYKIKSVLEHPRTETHQLYGALLEMEKIYKRFQSEGKEMPESDEYLNLDDMKLLASRFFDGLSDAIRERYGEQGINHDM